MSSLFRLIAFRRCRYSIAIAVFLGIVVGLHTNEASSQQTGSALPEYRIDAVRYATFPDFPTSIFIASAAEDERIDAAAVIWVLRGNDRTILFDSGFHRTTFLENFPVKDLIRPDRAVELAGVSASEVTDIIISHAHWDHMGGIDLFPNATIWIQEEEYNYYTSEAWQPGGNSENIDAEDVIILVRKNTDGNVRQIKGDGVEILPGITAYTGARHTFASQYIRIGGSRPYVLASDNCYLYRNLEEMEPIAITFSDSDRDANKAALERMIGLAGSLDRVVPGHDPEQFTRFPTEGRVARIN